MANQAVVSDNIHNKHVTEIDCACGNDASNQRVQDTVPRIPVIGKRGDIVMASLAPDSELATYIATSTAPASNASGSMRGKAAGSDDANYKLASGLPTVGDTASHASRGTSDFSETASDVGTSRSRAISQARCTSVEPGTSGVGENLTTQHELCSEDGQAAGYRARGTLPEPSRTIGSTSPSKTHIAGSGAGHVSSTGKSTAPETTMPSATGFVSSGVAPSTGTRRPVSRQPTQRLQMAMPAASARASKYSTPGIPLSELVIKTFYKGLKTLDHLLTVAEAHAKESNVDANAMYPDARLADDMLPFTFQVQNATTTVRKTMSRIGMMRTQIWPDTERTMGELHDRIEKAFDLLDRAEPKLIDQRLNDLVEL